MNRRNDEELDVEGGGVESSSYPNDGYFCYEDNGTNGYRTVTLTKRGLTVFKLAVWMQEHGRPREGLTHAYSLFRSLSEDENLKYYPTRFYLFKIWCDTFVHDEKGKVLVEAKNGDVRALKVLAENPKEIKLIRCIACDTLRNIYWFGRQQTEEAGHWRYEAIRLGQKAKRFERFMRLSAIKLGITGKTGITAGEVLDEYVGRNQKFRAQTALKLTGSELLQDLSILQRCEALFPCDEDFPNDILLHLLSFGGELCDSCQKSPKDCKMKRLLVCKRCNRAYYCSVECQTKQWNEGHKHHCRSAGKFKIGDYVKVTIPNCYLLPSQYKVFQIIGNEADPLSCCINGNSSEVEKWTLKQAWSQDGPEIHEVPSSVLSHLRPLM